MRGRAVLMLLAGLAVAAANSGCAQLESTRKYLMLNNPKDGTEEENDEWAVVGKEGRGDRPPEVEVDGWWDRLLHSPKARAINRNLGYVPD